MPSDFSYEEPSTAHLLIFSTYLWLLNMARWFVQRITGAGLLGEIAIGMIFGSPLAQWLDVDWQSTMVIVGYIGLLAIVLEGVSSTAQRKGRLSYIIDAITLRRYNDFITSFNPAHPDFDGHCLYWRGRYPRPLFPLRPCFRLQPSLGIRLWCCNVIHLPRYDPCCPGRYKGNWF